MPRVYLAGAIDGVPITLAKGWRAQARGLLVREGIAVADPTDPPLSEMLDAPKPESAETLIGRIVRRNTAMLRGSQAMLAELGFAAPHYGTTVEIELAVLLGIPVIVWMNGQPRPLYLRRHPWPAVQIADELDDAVAYVIQAVKAQTAPDHWRNTTANVDEASLATALGWLP